MSDKTMIMCGMVLGSFLGGYVPTLLGMEAFSLASLFGSTAGAFLGIWAAFRLTR